MNVKYKYKTKPYEHQKECLGKSWDKNMFALFMEMGTGKSKVLIDNLAILYEKDRINFALIIAPKGVYRNWSEIEIPTHMPDRIKPNIIVWKSGLTDKEKHSLRGSLGKDLTILVMNIEAFSSIKGKKAGEWLSKVFGSKGLVVVDESTMIKNHKAKRTKALVSMSRNFRYRRIMTGSPVTNSPLDIFSQCEFLGDKVLGFDSYYPFQARYSVMTRQHMGSVSFNKVVGYKNMNELSSKLEPFSFRVLKKDCLDLPDKIYTSRYVTMTPQQKEMYEDIRKKAVLMLDDNLITAPMIATQLIRLQQILSGHIRTDDGELITFDTQRMSSLLEICNEVSGKAIIWSRFRYDIENITKNINKNFGSEVAVSFYGDTSDNQRQDNIRRFQNPQSPIRFFIGNPQTAGRGITLTEANTVVYYANDFNLDTRMQSEDRCHRIGLKNPVTYIDLICDKTIDTKIVKSLRGKINLSAKVLGEEVREWLNLTT
tara:strand:+ start:451 stop:1902 length:1452 start_codon:yes stop_codon:yes gene_type:complete